MAFDNTNTFVLFKNKERKTDKHPAYTGTINIEGVDHKLAGWVREPKNGGEKFIGGTIELKQQAAQPRSAPKSNDDEFDSDLPF